MKIVELTCIGCPMGCALRVTMDGETVIEVTGNTCENGNQYARKEVTNPTRIVTSSVRVSGSRSGAVTVSCKTRTDVPKSKMFEVVQSLKNVSVPAPVRIGDVIEQNAAGIGVDVVATKNVD
jgi:CxxC motif-containing protein